MKKLVVNNPVSCVQCRSCEDACALLFYGAYRRSDLSCIRVETGEYGEGFFRHCTQCGKCAEACPVSAVIVNGDGVYEIDRQLCIGCMQCADACPEKIICQSPDGKYASKCTACGACVRNCPMDVLAIE